jgi:hypothetical protein
MMMFDDSDSYFIRYIEEEGFESGQLPRKTPMG